MGISLNDKNTILRGDDPTEKRNCITTELFMELNMFHGLRIKKNCFIKYLMTEMASIKCDT